MAKYTLSDDAKKNYITKIAGIGLTLFLKALKIPDSAAEKAGAGLQELISGVEAVKEPDDFRKHWDDALDRMWERVEREIDLPHAFWVPLENKLFRSPEALKLLVESADPVKDLEAEIVLYYRDSKVIDVSTLPVGLSDAILLILDEEIKNDIALYNSFYVQATDRKLEQLIRYLDKHLFKNGLLLKDSQIDGYAQKPVTTSGKRYITDIPKTRYILDDYDDDEEFEFYPDRLYVLSLYFIVLSLRNEQYVIFDYVSYSPIEKNGRVNDDIWSVPYTIFPVDLKGKKVRSVRQIKSVYNRALEGLSKTLENLEWGLFYNLGIVYKELEKGKEYIEYRRSATEPDKMRCNYVREFFVHDVDSTGVTNLVDPECLHQHRYVPFSLIDRYFYNGNNKIPYDGNIGRGNWDGLYRFMDKPIPENVSAVLIDERTRLKSFALSVEKEHLSYSIYAFLFKIEVVLLSEDFSFSVDDKSIISSMFDKAMTSGNIGKFRTSSNEVVGEIPLEKNDITITLSELYTWIRQAIVNKYDGNSQLADSFAICCTILPCTCEYGKKYGLETRSAAFYGGDYNSLILSSEATKNIAKTMKAIWTDSWGKILLATSKKDGNAIRIDGAYWHELFFNESNELNLKYYVWGREMLAYDT